MSLTNYLGAHVNDDLLVEPPFSKWKSRKSTEEDLPTVRRRKEVRYVFDGHGFEVLCDEVERIRAIFLQRGDGETLSEIPFSISRREVLERYGTPSRSGGPVWSRFLGGNGAWDRFAFPTFSLHVQYRLDRDEIEMITLMCLDVVP